MEISFSADRRRARRRAGRGEQADFQGAEGAVRRVGQVGAIVPGSQGRAIRPVGRSTQQSAGTAE